MNVKNNSISSPKKRNQLFKAILGDWHNACLYAFHEDLNWSMYLFGYKKAGDILVDYVGNSRSHQDSLVYPIVFLYRQYVELQLKLIIKEGYQLLSIKKNYKKCHKIDELWRDCKEIITRIWPQETSEMILIDDIITEFSLIDPISTAFRYPTNKNGNLSLPDNLLHINLRNLSDHMQKIDDFLGPVCDAISIDLAEKKEYENYT